MASKIYIDNDGNLSGLADDLLDKLNHMGTKKVSRVSNVEYNHTHQCWTATDLEGKMIAQGKIRREVIEKEREHLNRVIEEAFNTAVLL